MSHFFQISLDQVIDKMASNSAQMDGDAGTIRGWLRQQLLCWSGHVNSWTKQTLIPVYVVRFEDMKLAPRETFSNVLETLEIPKDFKGLKKLSSFPVFNTLKSKKKNTASKRIFLEDRLSFVPVRLDLGRMR